MIAACVLGLVGIFGSMVRDWIEPTGFAATSFVQCKVGIYERAVLGYM